MPTAFVLKRCPDVSNQSSWRRENYMDLWRSEKEESLIIVFFMQISRQTTDRLPWTLRTLKLSDQHSHNIKLLNRHISDAVNCCPNLVTLEIANKIDEFQLAKSSAKFFYVPTSNRVLIRSWLRISSEEGYDAHFRYQGPRNEAWSTNVLAEPLDHPLRSILETLTDMVDTESRTFSKIGTIQFVKECSVPPNVVMVAPHDCGHTVYPSLCFKCTSQQSVRDANPVA